MCSHGVVLGTFPDFGIVEVRNTGLATWQKDIWFARFESSHVRAHGTTDGFAFGVNGDKHSQIRGLIEAGIIL